MQILYKVEIKHLSSRKVKVLDDGGNYALTFINNINQYIKNQYFI